MPQSLSQRRAPEVGRPPGTASNRSPVEGIGPNATRSPAQRLMEVAATHHLWTPPYDRPGSVRRGIDVCGV